MRILKWFLVIAITTSMAFVIYRSAELYSGKCLKDGRTMTDDEPVRIVVQYIVARRAPVIEMEVAGADGEPRIDRQRPTEYVAYESSEDFVQENPDCCAVVMATDEGGPAPLIDRITGRIAAYVRVRYQVRYVDYKSARKESRIEQSYAMTNCGHPWNGI